ncbi:uncharacterized protein LOC143459121 [Clavelina lepadiformis]|uniref:uncharacterized protein LOC143459121 n=1 Tax=Clavelina lepadiformis TaxID=159417 RepID=UPI004041C031
MSHFKRVPIFTEKKYWQSFRLRESPAVKYFNAATLPDRLSHNNVYRGRQIAFVLRSKKCIHKSREKNSHPTWKVTQQRRDIILRNEKPVDDNCYPCVINGRPYILLSSIRNETGSKNGRKRFAILPSTRMLGQNIRSRNKFNFRVHEWESNGTSKLKAERKKRYAYPYIQHQKSENFSAICCNCCKASRQQNKQQLIVVRHQNGNNLKLTQKTQKEGYYSQGSVNHPQTNLLFSATRKVNYKQLKLQREVQREYRLKRWLNSADDGSNCKNISPPFHSIGKYYQTVGRTTEKVTFAKPAVDVSQRGYRYHPLTFTGARAVNNMAKVVEILSSSHVNDLQTNRLKGGLNLRTNDSGIWCDSGLCKDPVLTDCKANFHQHNNQNRSDFVSRESFISSYLPNTPFRNFSDTSCSLQSPTSQTFLLPESNDTKKQKNISKSPIVGCTWWQNSTDLSQMTSFQKSMASTTSPSWQVDDDLFKDDTSTNDQDASEGNALLERLPNESNQIKATQNYQKRKCESEHVVENWRLHHREQHRATGTKQKIGSHKLKASESNSDGVVLEVESSSSFSEKKSSYQYQKKPRHKSSAYCKRQSDSRKYSRSSEDELPEDKSYSRRSRRNRRQRSSNTDNPLRHSYNNRCCVARDFESTENCKNSHPLSVFSNDKFNNRYENNNRRLKIWSSGAVTQGDSNAPFQIGPGYKLIGQNENHQIIYECTCKECQACYKQSYQQSRFHGDSGKLLSGIPAVIKSQPSFETGTEQRNRRKKSDQFSQMKRGSNASTYNGFSTFGRTFGVLSLCFRCFDDSSESSDSGGSDTGDDDDEGGQDEGADYVEHGDGVSVDDDSGGDDSGSDSGGDVSMDTAELFDDQNNMFDMKTGLGDMDGSDDGPGSADSDCSDSLTELRSRSKKSSGTSDEFEDDDDDMTYDDDDFLDSWESFALYERE